MQISHNVSLDSTNTALHNTLWNLILTVFLYSYSYSYPWFSLESWETSEARQHWEMFCFGMAPYRGFTSLWNVTVAVATFQMIFTMRPKSQYLSLGCIFMRDCHMDGLQWMNGLSGRQQSESPPKLSLMHTTVKLLSSWTSTAVTAVEIIWWFMHETCGTAEFISLCKRYTCWTWESDEVTSKQDVLISQLNISRVDCCFWQNVLLGILTALGNHQMKITILNSYQIHSSLSRALYSTGLIHQHAHSKILIYTGAITSLSFIMSLWLSPTILWVIISKV